MIEGNERRTKIEEMLSSNSSPISGTKLAQILGVSRQVIVQDIALLRAKNKDILSTNKGYILYDSHEEENFCSAIICVRHSKEETFDELKTIVELGGRVKDVFVDHDFYGQIHTDLIINDLSDVEDFVKTMNDSKSQPLKVLTGDIHYHTILAPTQKVLSLIRKELQEKSFLVE